MPASKTSLNLLKVLIFGFVLAGVAVASPTIASAGKFKVLYSQCSEDTCAAGTGGSTGPLVMDAAGNFYGTTPDGEAFALKRTDKGNLKYRAILSFNGGAPSGGMIIDTQGNLYGWASQFYKMTYGHGSHHNRWSAEFPTLNCSTPPCSGTNPRGTLTYTGAAFGAPWDGVSPLYGVMGDGGVNNGGTVYQLTPGDGAWTYTVLYNFCAQTSCADGSTPSGVLLDQSGNLYGTTLQGGGHDDGNIAGGAGTVFELSPAGGGSWRESILHAFCSEANCTDGAFPWSNLTRDAAGNFIGVTAGGGTGKRAGGTLFRVTPGGMQSQETVLYNFCQRKDCKDGESPSGTPVLDSAGNIFGTTEEGGGNDTVANGGGVAYEFTGTELRILHSFCSQPSCVDGWDPFVGLSQDGSGQFFGTADGGGAFNEGAVYELTP